MATDTRHTVWEKVRQQWAVDAMDVVAIRMLIGDQAKYLDGQAADLETNR